MKALFTLLRRAFERPSTPRLAHGLKHPERLVIIVCQPRKGRR